MKIRKQHSMFVVGFAIVLGLATLGHAEDLDGRHAWTAVGSVGTPDESDVEEVRMAGSRVRFTSTEPGSARIRYNVAATDALIGTMLDGSSWKLDVAFRDTGVNDRVRVYLRQYSLAGGAATLLSFDSDDHEAEARFGRRVESAEASGIDLDFRRNAYCLEVILNRYGTDGVGAAFMGASLAPAESAE